MKSAEIIEAYFARFKKLSKYYHGLLEDFNSKDIHHFRLEIKKLKAFLQLLNFSSKEHYKIPDELKLFYDLTGNLRNLQLHVKRIGDLCNDLMLQKPEVYLRFLDEEQKALRKQARQMAKHISLKELEATLIGEVPTRLTRKGCRNFIQKNRERLRELFALTFYTDEALHEVRKIIKGWMYNAKYLLQGRMPRLFSDLHGLKAMKVITVLLGDYHDVCVGLSLLSSIYVTKIVSLNETEELNEIKIQLQSRKEVMKIEILEMMKQLERKPEAEPSAEVAEAAICGDDHKHPL